jgi:NAD(P)-dependent dehydrogenase (short-subunit alcohol dehydrogenase family)
VKDALAKLGAARFDFLVNNAGNNHRNMPFEKATVQELDSVYNVHFKGVFFLTQKLLPPSTTADASSTYRLRGRASARPEGRFTHR